MKLQKEVLNFPKCNQKGGKNMNISIISKNTSVRDSFRERCEKKFAKLDRFFGEDAKAAITVTNQNGRETVEATITAGGMFFRAEKTTSDRLDSLEAVVDVLTKQITRNKKKLEHKFRGEKFSELAVDFYEEPADDYGIVKTKQFRVNPMDVQEAILQMNLLGHNFFMFRNTETGEINVVYKRNDGDYGVLEPID
jgi:putative sigma-54 modulation protein